MTIMESISNTPAKVNDDMTSISNTQDENKPINDNSACHGNLNTTLPESIEKNSNEKKSPDISDGTVANEKSTVASENIDEDLEEGEISDDDEELSPQKAPSSSNVSTEDPSRSSKHSKESSVASNISDANQNKRPEEESEQSDNGRKNGEKEEEKQKERKSRRDKRSDRDLRKELQDDEAKKREIKEKIRALEMQMKMDEDEGEDDEDLEEMGILGVGGSPREGRKRRKGKSESDSNNEVDQGQGERGDRSRSRSPKRRKREREDNRRRRGREQDEKRNFGGGGFGTGFNRNGLRGDKSSELCKLYMQGKCPKSPQNCLYSHEGVPPKIMELCKFYLLERCAKREKCLYLHKGFPCKYFHTGHRCMDDAESCKFSHDNLSDVTRTILLKHLEAAPKEILGDFPRLSREKALELVYKTEAKNKGWETLEKSKEDPQPRSAGDSFVEQQTLNKSNIGNENGNGFGTDERSRGSIKHQQHIDDTTKKSRWEADTSGSREFDAPFQQGPPPPLMAPPPSNFFRGPGLGPRGPGSGPFGPRAPMGMGFGPRGPNSGLGLLGQAPGQGPMPQRMMGSGFSQGAFNQREPPVGENRSLSMVPPGYGEPDFGEDQVKHFLKAQRQGENNSSGIANNSNASKWGNSSEEWSGPTIPAGPNAFASQPPNLRMGATGNQKFPCAAENTSSEKSPDRETTPTPEDNMDFGENKFDSKKEEQLEEKSISQRKVYEELQRKHKEKEMRLDTVKEPNPMFKEDNWYSSEEDSEEKSDRSFSEELLKTPANLKRASPEKKTSVEEKERESNSTIRTSQSPVITTTILSLRETPATPPPPPTLSASDRDSMEASSTNNGRVALPKELTQVLSSIQNTPSSSTSFESNTSSPGSGKRDPRTSRDPRQLQKNDPRMSRPSSQSGTDSLSESEREREKEKRILEMDLSIFGELDLPTFKDSEDNSTGNESPITEEESALNLPFKAHKVHQVAKEIDASIYSHSPLEYRLRAILIAKPDYSDMIVKQHIPASKVQQDPRLRRYSNKIPGKPSSAANQMLLSDRRFSDDGIQILSPPGPNKNKVDPRRNKNNISHKPIEQKTSQQEEENVYNPKKDLYSSRPPPQQQYVPQMHQQQQENYNQEVYSPTQDVQDMYSSKYRKQTNISEDTNSYNPRQDFNPGQRNPINQGPPPGITPLVSTAPWSAGNGANQYSPYDNNFYGGSQNQHNYGGNSNDESGFYNSNQNNFGGMNTGGRGGFGGDMHGGGMMAGVPNRSSDPRTNRRDPRRKD